MEDQPPERNLFPVSVKGVLLCEGGVVLLENEREEWELPGGKLEVGESPEECVRREIREELGLNVEVGPLLDAWVYEVTREARVLVLTYGCFALDLGGISHSVEHSAVAFFALGDLENVELPHGYGRSIRTWASHSVFSDRPGQ